MPPDSTVPVVGWMNYGGIIRDVSLYSTGPERIRFMRIDSPAPGREDAGEVTVTLEVDGPEKPGKLRIDYTVVGPDGAEAAAGSAVPDGTGVFRVSVPAPCLWWPEKPALYRLNVSLYAAGRARPDDTVSETFGFRTVRLDEKGFTLNGKRVYIRGISRHDEHPAFGRTVPSGVAEKELRDIKDLGLNAVRLVHYPHDQKVLDTADRLGLLVWCEPPVYWHADFTQEKTRALYIQQTAEMVQRDINHPSVFIWGIGNEIHTEYAETVSAMEAVLSRVCSLDKSRPAAFASWFMEPEKNRALDLFDCICVNKYAGWYGETTDNLKDDLVRLRKHRPTVPVIISEFGAGAVRGLHGPETQRWSEEYQSRVLAENIRIFESLPFVAGYFIWTYADFKDPSRVHSIYEANLNNKGIVDINRQPKAAYFMLKKLFSGDGK
jgi:beta-glucuronidase